MVFVLDVGNSNIKCGLFDGDRLVNSWRIATKLERTADDYGIRIMAFFNHLGRKPDEVEGIIISSVIPSINYTLQHMFTMYFGKKAMMVGPGMKTGINILYDNPKELGTDRIAGAVAAYTLYGGPCIIVDFGTATTFGAVSAGGDFLGGAICPGIRISAEALASGAAKLPRVELVKPESVIARNTVAGMQAGIIYGYVGQVDYIIRRMKAEMGGSPRVIATGGMANVIAQETQEIDEVNSLLTLIGLNILYYKNKKRLRIEGSQ
ncbi:MAG: type III pantothenate kinase [Christensenellaceae bacterium]|nr:type III pantothenate kinase [Christensenellaceae bacterium]